MRSFALILAFAALGLFAATASAGVPFAPIPPTVPRPAGENVPAAAGVLRISWTQPGRQAIVVTDPAKVRRIARIVDELPVEGRGFCAEGFIVGPPTITFSFRHKRRGSALAVAREAAHQDFGIAWCVPTIFSVRGRVTVRLEGGSYLLTQAEKILKRTLTTP